MCSGVRSKSALGAKSPSRHRATNLRHFALLSATSWMLCAASACFPGARSSDVGPTQPVWRDISQEQSDSVKDSLLGAVADSFIGIQRVAPVRIGARHFVLIDGGTGRGTGWQQRAFALVTASRPSPPIVTWEAVAYESAALRFGVNLTYEVTACLLTSANDTLLYSRASTGDTKPAGDTLEKPSGAYVMSDTGLQLRRVRDLSASETKRCRSHSTRFEGDLHR